MPDAISYKRFSSRRQTLGDSDRRQTQLTEEYCKRHGLRLIDTYLDAGLSAFTGENLGDSGALKKLLDAARTGKFRRGTVLIVESLDRLTRQEMSTAVRLFLDLLDTGLAVVTLIDGEQVFTKERVDSDLTALIIAIVILLRANNESRNKRERARQAQATARQKARERHIPISTKCPVWLTVTGKGDNKRFMVNEDRARTVRRIYRLAASGLGQHRIARALNEEHVPTFSGKPRWRGAAIAHLLVSKAVIGVLHPYSSTIENGRTRRIPDPEGPIRAYYPAIISQSLFAEARRATEGRRTRRKEQRDWAYTNLVSRIGRCVVCGETLYLNGPSKGFGYLRCVGTVHGDCRNSAGFPYHSLEPMLLVLDELSEIVARFVSDSSGRNPARRILQLEASVRRAKRDLGRLAFAFGNMAGRASQTARKQMERLNIEIQNKENELVEREAELQQTGIANRKRFSERFKAAKASAHSPNIEERYLGRAALTAECRRVIEGVVLHEHRIATIHMKPDAAGCQIVYLLDPYGLHGVQVTGRDGTIGFIGPAALLNFEETFTKTSDRHAPRRSRRLAKLLECIPVAQTPSGDWRTKAPHVDQMPAIVARAGRLLTEGAVLVGDPRRTVSAPVCNLTVAQSAEGT